MKPIDKLLKLLDTDNIADKISDDFNTEGLTQSQIVQSVLRGYKLDDESRQQWLASNQEAVEIIKNCENNGNDDSLDIPIYKEAKVIYPLLANATITLAARMIQQLVRNNRVAECTVVGQDKQIVIPNPKFDQSQPPSQQNMPFIVEWEKEGKAKRSSDFLNYQLLVESDSWLKDSHKLCQVLAGWGTAFRQVYYDPVSKKNCDELIAPEDVIINHNITSLEKAKRITIKHYLTINEIVEQQRAGYFTDFDIQELKSKGSTKASEQRDENPYHTVLCQFCYLDLDNDGYAEPYKVYIHEDAQKLLGIYPAFDYDDVIVDDKGLILKITPKIDVVDYHLIDDPEGKYYSIGLNYLLLHPNKAITTLLRQLVDAGNLANAGACSGFMTSAFKTQEQDMEVEMGTWKKIDIASPNMNPQQHIIPLPVRDPSQVLLSLLQVLIESGEKMGLITDVLTGDIAGTNVPATTMLAMIEQSTRVFKPVIQKLQIANKKLFKIHFYLNSKYLDKTRYAVYNNKPIEASATDFDADSMDIMPVADPNQSSEAHHYAKLQFIIQLMATPAINAMNLQENLRELYQGMEYQDPERFINPPPDPSQNPEMIKLQIQQQDLQHAQQMNELKAQNDQLKMQLAAAKLEQKQQEINIKKYEAQVNTQVQSVQAHNAAVQADNQSMMANFQGQKLDLEAKKLDLMDKKLEIEKKKVNKPKNF